MDLHFMKSSLLWCICSLESTLLIIITSAPNHFMRSMLLLSIFNWCGNWIKDTLIYLPQIKQLAISRRQCYAISNKNNSIFLLFLNSVLNKVTSKIKGPTQTFLLLQKKAWSSILRRVFSNSKICSLTIMMFKLPWIFSSTLSPTQAPSLSRLVM